MLADFREMTAGWRARGLYAPDWAFWSLWCAAVAALCGLGVWLRGLSGGVVLGVAWAHCGFVQHHAGHMGYLRLQTLFECFLKGGSARWWRNRHTKHHACPNVPGALCREKATPGARAARAHAPQPSPAATPPGLRRQRRRPPHDAVPRVGPRSRKARHHPHSRTPAHPAPITTLSQRALTRASAPPAPRRKCPSACLRVQHLSFLPLLALYVPIFFVTTKKYLAHRRAPPPLPHQPPTPSPPPPDPPARDDSQPTNHNSQPSQPRNRSFKQLKLEVAALAAHWAVALWLLPPRELAVLYAVGYAVQGVYLGFFFALSHFHLPRFPGADVPWPRLQASASADWNTGSAASRLASGFLNLQIEHHFAPMIPPEKLAVIAPEARGALRHTPLLQSIDGDSERRATELRPYKSHARAGQGVLREARHPLHGVGLLEGGVQHLRRAAQDRGG